MKKKLIIFDLDGVLINSRSVVSEYFMYLHPNLTERHLQEMLCGNFHEELEKIKKIHPKIAETPEEEEKRKAAYSEKKSRCPAYGGISELLEVLHIRGDILTINTSAFARNSVPILEKAGIHKYFDLIATADISKSKVEKFKVIQEKYKTSTEDIIFITDTLGDILEAKEAGIKTIVVTYGAQEREYLVREKHENVIAMVDSVEELQNMLLS